MSSIHSYPTRTVTLSSSKQEMVTQHLRLEFHLPLVSTEPMTGYIDLLAGDPRPLNMAQAEGLLKCCVERLLAHPILLYAEGGYRLLRFVLRRDDEKRFALLGVKLYPSKDIAVTLKIPGALQSVAPGAIGLYSTKESDQVPRRLAYFDLGVPPHTGHWFKVDELRKDVGWREVRNAGDNPDHLAPRDALNPKLAWRWLLFLIESGLIRSLPLDANAGKFVGGKDVIADAFRAVHQPPTKHTHLRLDPLLDGEGIADHEVRTPDQLVSLRDVTDLRARLDSLPLLAEVIGRVDPTTLQAATDYIAPVVDLVEQHRDPALQAAILYWWSRRRGRASHGGWSREEVATAFKVSPHQLDRRARRAQELLGDLNA